MLLNNKGVCLLIIYERKTTLMEFALPYDVNLNALFELGLSEGK